MKAFLIIIYNWKGIYKVSRKKKLVGIIIKKNKEKEKITTNNIKLKTNVKLKLKLKQ